MIVLHHIKFGELRNLDATNKGEEGDFAPFRDRGKEDQVDHLWSNTYHLVKNVKIGPADLEIISLKEIILKNMKLCKQNT